MIRLITLAIVIATITVTPAIASPVMPSIYKNDGPLTLPDGSTHVQRGEGWVQHHPRVYLIFWGDSWSITNPVVVAERALFQQMATPAATGYTSILNQYGVNADTFAGSYIDPAGPDHSVTLKRLTKEAAKVRRINHWSNTPDTQWVILPQVGSEMGWFTDECGEHDDRHIGKQRYFIDLIPPFQNPQYGYNCIADYSSDDGLVAANLTNATTSITTHEYAETATDPYASTGASYGWSTDNNNEIADLCAWYSGIPTGMTVNVTYLWSNAANGCVL